MASLVGRTGTTDRLLTSGTDNELGRPDLLERSRREDTRACRLVRVESGKNDVGPRGDCDVLAFTSEKVEVPSPFATRFPTMFCATF